MTGNIKEEEVKNIRLFIKSKSCLKVTSGQLMIAVLACCISMLSTVESFADHYPLRSEYPDLTPITTDELDGIFEDVIIIDARSGMEFDVIHMRGAVNISVGTLKECDLLRLRDKNGAQLMVFYCNGHTCAKSYKATRKARKLGFKHIKV